MAVAVLIESLVAALGETDCEELGGGLLAQPTNAISSLSYVVVGGAIAWSVRRSWRANTGSLAYAACVAAIGVGSVAFHGPQTSGSQIMHDLPILITALFILNHDLVLLRPVARGELATFVGASAVATIVAVLVQASVPPLTGVVLGGVAIAEWLIYRRRLRPIDSGRQRRLYLTIVVVAAVAGASWLLGRSNSPACQPGSVLQVHGLWHVISAGLFALWWWLALKADR